MNRPRKSRGPYPPSFYLKHGAFYLVRRNKWIRLGTDLGLALAEYARIMEGEKAGGMPGLIAAALPGIISGKADTTRSQYTTAAATLSRKLRQFEPQDVTQTTVYAVLASMSDTPNMANRTLSVLSQVFTYAAQRGLVQSNPCIGIKRLREAKRTRLISDAEWHAIHAHAGKRLQVVMELQHLTGQRIVDVLTIRRSQGRWRSRCCGTGWARPPTTPPSTRNGAGLAGWPASRMRDRTTAGPRAQRRRGSRAATRRRCSGTSRPG
jgi:integrase